MCAHVRVCVFSRVCDLMGVCVPLAVSISFTLILTPTRLSHFLQMLLSLQPYVCLLCVYAHTAKIVL